MHEWFVVVGELAVLLSLCHIDGTILRFPMIRILWSFDSSDDLKRTTCDGTTATVDRSFTCLLGRFASVAIPYVTVSLLTISITRWSSCGNRCKFYGSLSFRGVLLCIATVCVPLGDVRHSNFDLLLLDSFLICSSTRLNDIGGL